MKVISSLNTCSCHYDSSLADLVYMLFISNEVLIQASAGKSPLQMSTHISNMPVITQNARCEMIISSHVFIIIAACAAFSDLRGYGQKDPLHTSRFQPLWYHGDECWPSQVPEPTLFCVAFIFNSTRSCMSADI